METKQGAAAVAHHAQFALGVTVREKLTGVQGRVIGITFWETGCTQVGVKRLGLDKDDKPHDVLWFDEINLDLIGDDPASAPNAGDKPGGPLTSGKTLPTR
jgi:hypothetical protein